MAERLRVAQVVLDLEAGGLERLVADTIRTLDPARFESHLVVLDFFGRYAEGLEQYATLHQAPPLGRLTMLWPGPLIRLFRAIRPDVVHTHSGVWYKASLAARLAGVPRLVHTEHGRARWPDPLADRIVDRLAARRTDVVIAVSEAVARQVGGTIVGDPRKIRVIRNGVDTALFAPAPDDGLVRRELGIGDAPIIGSIGRFDPIKGYDVVVDAFALLLRDWTTGPKPVLLLVGDGPEREAITRRVAERGIAGQVRLPGWRSDVLSLLHAFTIFTLGSRSEGTSIGLLEAMAAGACPVVTAVGGNPDVLGPDLAHRLVPAEQGEPLARAWKDSLGDADRRAADARVARRRVEERFSLAGMVREYEGVYAGARTS